MENGRRRQQRHWCIMYIIGACEIGQLWAKVQAPVSGNEARVVGWGGRPAWWSASFVNDRCGCRHWWAGTVARPPNEQVQHRSAAATPSSECIFQVSMPLCLSVRAYSERERLAGGGGGAEPTLRLSRLAVLIKDVSE